MDLSVINALLLVMLVLAQAIMVLAKRKKNNPGNSLGALKVEIRKCNEEITRVRDSQREIRKDLSELKERVAVIRAMMDE